MAYVKTNWVNGLTPVNSTNLNNIENGIEANDTLKAPLDSPAFTNNPTAPTQADLNDSTRLATTAYVMREANKKVPSTRTLTAGNGLTGGGDLTANRTVTLGTPSTLTSATTNSVTATSHTHTITVTKTDVGLSNVDNVQQEPKTFRGQLTVTNASWVVGTYGPYAYRKTIGISGVVATDTPIVGFTLTTKEIAQRANISHVESYSGGIYLYSNIVPSGSVTIDYRILKGV